ncbi:MAG TPA: hypothetical protein PKD86_10480 [Gemmatales bacterium]|nr:hypothetical protein [Gemmatales bacterium]HMP59770.1 hypothetical protein [Gemmatales bacterium]
MASSANAAADEGEEALLIAGTTRDSRIVQGGERPCREVTRHEFVITAWKHAPVEIKAVRLGCGCGTLSPNLAGVNLNPNESTTLVLEVLRREQAGEKTATIAIDAVTMKKPCTFTFGVTFTFYGGPATGPDRVAVTTPVGQTPRPVFRISRWRLSREPALVWDPAGSDFGPWQPSLLRAESTTRRQYEHQKVPLEFDVIDLDVALDNPLQVGEHAFEFKVAIKGQEPVAVPVRVHVLHPMRPSLSSVFAGRLEPGQKWSYGVRWLRAGTEQVQVAKVEVNHPAITASATPDYLFVTVTAPQEAGRFAGEIVVQFDSPSVPPIRVPVSGLVVAPVKAGR